MATITIRLNEEEKAFAEKMAKFEGRTLSEMFKEHTFNYLEDEYDLKVYQDFKEREAKGEVVLVSHEEMMKEFGL